MHAGFRSVLNAGKKKRFPTAPSSNTHNCREEGHFGSPINRRTLPKTVNRSTDGYRIIPNITVFLMVANMARKTIKSLNFHLFLDSSISNPCLPREFYRSLTRPTEAVDRTGIGTNRDRIGLSNRDCRIGLTKPWPDQRKSFRLIFPSKAVTWYNKERSKVLSI